MSTNYAQIMSKAETVTMQAVEACLSAAYRHLEGECPAVQYYRGAPGQNMPAAIKGEDIPGNGERRTDEHGAVFHVGGIKRYEK